MMSENGERACWRDLGALKMGKDRKMDEILV
jgi:hypothetical protein